MEKKAFIKFCDNEFKKRGFVKVKKGYYLNGEKGVLCGIFLQRSNYSKSYYINYYFFLGEFENEKNYPMNYDLDVQGRILAMSKTQKKQGKKYILENLNILYFLTLNKQEVMYKLKA